jgi:PD-(D/E)XK nuclease superfamily
MARQILPTSEQMGIFIKTELNSLSFWKKKGLIILCFYALAVLELAIHANPQPFLDQVKEILLVHSNRDAMQFHEGSLKAIFISLLHHQQFYYISSEEEEQRRYIDIHLEAIRGYKPNYEIAFELKYLKKKDTSDVNDVLDAAEIQLKQYLVLKKYIRRKNLRGFVVVVKNEAIFWKEITIP